MSSQDRRWDRPWSACRSGTPNFSGLEEIHFQGCQPSHHPHAENSPSQTSPQNQNRTTMQLCSHTLSNSGPVLFPHWRVLFEGLSSGRASIFLLLPIKIPGAVLSPSLPSIASDRVCQLAEVRISFLQTTCFQSVGPKVS